MSADYFAELYVAGRFADAGWNVYFPHRDQGFDFIVSRPDSDEGQLIRPVQVKGKYPEDGTGNRVTYGFIGELTQRHPEMVLAIPYFKRGQPEAPVCVAYIPSSMIRGNSRGVRCHPAKLIDGIPSARRDYAKFFDQPGLLLTNDKGWKNTTVIEVEGDKALD